MLFDPLSSTSSISDPLFAQHASLDNRHSHRFATADDLADDSIAMLESLTSLEPRPLQSIVEFCRAILSPPANGTLSKSGHSPRPKPLFFRTSGCKTASLDSQVHCSFSSFRTGHRLAGGPISSLQSSTRSRPFTLASQPAHEWTRRTRGPAGPRLCGASPRVRHFPFVSFHFSLLNSLIRVLTDQRRGPQGPGCAEQSSIGHIPLLTTQPSHPSPH